MYRTLFFLLVLAACQSPAPTSPAKVDQPATAGPHFVFSTAARQTDLHDANNWCIHSFHEAIRLDGASGNANRRIFALGTGAHRIVVDAGGQSASFILKKSAAQTVEVFTSDNYPVCLSDRSKFSLDAGNRIFHYDNGRLIRFTAEVAEQPNGWVIALEMEPGAGYGFLVHRCEDCE